MMSDRYRLSAGRHPRAEQGRCAMEWVAHLAGEAHSDRPECVTPVVGAFARSWNDALDETTRQRLRPYLGRMIGTAGDGLDDARAWRCTDWLRRPRAPGPLGRARVGGAAGGRPRPRGGRASQSARAAARRGAGGAGRGPAPP